MATVIDALLVTLGLDSKEFHKGSEESQTDLEKLRNKTKEVAQDIKSQGEQAGEFFIKFAERAALLLGVGFSLHELKKDIAETAAEYNDLAKLAEQFHSTTEAIEQFADAGKLIGLSKDVTIGGLKQLDRAVQDTALGLGRAKIVFKGLGIEVKDSQGHVKSTTQVMGELAEKFKGMERGRQIRVMERLGLDPALIKLFNTDLVEMQRRTEAIDKATGFNLDKAVKNSQAFTKAVKSLQVEINSLKMFFDKLFEAAYINVMPALVEMMSVAKEYANDFFNFMLEHKDLVVGVFIAIGAGITYFLLPPLVAAAAAALAVIVPFLGIAAAIAAAVAIFAVLYEDWAVWMDGGTSALGDFWQFFADIWRKIGGTVLQIMGDIGAIFKDTFAGTVDIVKLAVAIMTGDIGAIKHVWSNLCGDMGTLWGDLWRMAGDLFNAFSAMIGAALDGIGASFDSLAPNVMGVFRAIRDEVLSLVAIVVDIFSLIVGIVTGDTQMISDAFAALVTHISVLFNSIGDGMLSAWRALWSGLQSVAGGVLDWLAGRIEAIAGLFSKIGQALGLVKASAPAVGTSTQAAGSAPGEAAAANGTPGAAATPVALPASVMPSAADSAAALNAARPASASSSIPPSVATNTDNKTTITKETHIGEITIQTQATDAQGIAKNIGQAVKSHSLADQADAGM